MPLARASHSQFSKFRVGLPHSSSRFQRAVAPPPSVFGLGGRAEPVQFVVRSAGRTATFQMGPRSNAFAASTPASAL